MSQTATLETEAAEASATAGFSAVKPGQPVLSARDLVTPVMVALICVDLYVIV